MRLIILGAGGYGRVLGDVAEQTGKYLEICFLDDRGRGSDILGTCGEFEKLINADTEFIPGFGDNAIRSRWCRTLQEQGAKLATVIHPLAYVSPRAVIGAGTAVLPKAAVNSFTEIGAGCIINLGAIIDHNCIVEDYSHVCLGAIVKAENRIPAYHKIQAGEVVENRTFPL